MAITIQDLIASDTISQAVDKINFNFDQLLLNGGGPLGPSGPQGAPGPIGGRGERGSDWYDGTVNPNTIIVSPSLLAGDYYLQSDGQVWEYNGTTWFITPVNLTGPTGTPGTSDGWLYIGNDGSGNVIPANKNTLYPSGMPGGAGATANNEGVSMVLVGGVTSQTPTVGYTYSAAYKLTDTMTSSLDSSLVSMLIHQKNTSARAIKFMGGDDTPENFEQDNIDSLAEIYLGADDVLNINIPKVTTPTNTSSAIGFNLYSGERGMNFRAGRGIKYLTGGMGSGQSGAYDIADYEILIQEINTALPPAFNVNIIGSKSASFQLGQTQPPTTNTFNGLAYLGADEILIDGRTLIEFKSDASTYIFDGLSSISTAPTGLVAYTAGESLTKIGFSGGTVPVGQISFNSGSGLLEGSVGADDYIASWDGQTKLQDRYWKMSGTAIYPVNVLGGAQDLGILSSGTINSLRLTGNSETKISFYDTGIVQNRPTLGFLGDSNITTGIARFVPGNEIPFQAGSTSVSRYNTNTQLQLNVTLANSIQGSSSGSWYQGVLPGTALLIGNRTVDGYNKAPLSVSRNFGKIEFDLDSNSTGKELGLEMAGIWARPGAASTASGNFSNNYWQDKPIVLKGSDGITNSSGGRHLGGGAAVIGGDGVTSGGSAGWVTLTPGGQDSLSATEYAKGVLIGFNPYYDLPNLFSTTEEDATRRSAAQVTIGPPLNMNTTSWSPDYQKDEIFLKVNQPPSLINIGNNDADRLSNSRYAMMIKSCYSDAEPAGALALYNHNNSNGIEIYPRLSGNAFTPHTEVNDGLLMFMNSGTNQSGVTGTDEGGLVISAKDRYWGAMRFGSGGTFDGITPNNPTEPKLHFYGHGSDTNVNDFKDLGFQVRSVNTILDHDVPLQISKNRSIFASGWMHAVPFSGSGNINQGASLLHWQRIGYTVTVTGNVQFGQGNGQRQVLLPVIGSSGTAAVRGNGTMEVGGSPGPSDPIHVVSTGTNAFSFVHDGVWVSTALSNMHVTFTYIMQ